MTTATSRRFTSAERAGIRHLERSGQFGRFIRVRDDIGAYVFEAGATYWPTVRQAARDSREAPNMWRCVTCDRLQPFFLKRCKACKGGGGS